jgi:predicted DsbA family dithiol-disulfide isomerase
LLQARGGASAEVFAAARRAGIEPDALRSALARRAGAPRLVRDRRIAQAARLTALPTLDIGRRRLVGEQSEREFLVAIPNQERNHRNCE